MNFVDPLANGPVGWTTGRVLLASRIVGASIGTAPNQRKGDAP